jgi:hypothetical protein
VANRTSDVALILDEIGQLESRESAQALYMLANGTGKIRMNRSATMQHIKIWRALILSSGEMTVETKIRQFHKATANTGAALRLLNVAADQGRGLGVFDAPGPTGNSADLVKAFSEAMNNVYGSAGPEFIRAIIARADCAETVREAVNRFIKEHVDPGADGQVERAAKRFGLIAAAGELATELGVTGWVYAGRVGTGMTEGELLALLRKLTLLASEEMTVDEPPPRDSRVGRPLELSRVHRVRPELVAEVTFLTWTADGLLRQVVYEGLREDKAARDVRRE